MSSMPLPQPENGDADSKRRSDDWRNRTMRFILGKSGAEDFNKGFGEGFRVTAEDRRDAVFARRDIEGKAEAPRYVTTLSQLPLLDNLRQYVSAAGPNDPVAKALKKAIPKLAFDDEMMAFRANSGLNIGDTLPEEDKLPTDLTGRSDTGFQFKDHPEGARDRVSAYKQSLRELPALRKAGYTLGSLTNDFTNNSTRNIWWLLNAPQAVVDVVTEAGVEGVNPALFGTEPIELQEAIDKGLVHYSPRELKDDDKLVVDEVRRIQDARRSDPFFDGDTMVDPNEEFGGYTAEGEQRQRKQDLMRAKANISERGRANASNYVRAHPGIRVIKGEVRRRMFNPNHLQLAAALPAAAAINTGIGLLGGQDSGAPGGRQLGYQATVPSEDDPRKTANVIAEVASKYLLGREGRLLEVEDFLLERPDVSRQEYQNYKGYLRDRDIDLNPFDDGRINLGGVIKNNPNGLKGAEVQFLGKNMGVNDTAIPVGSAIGGTMLGALAARNFTHDGKGNVRKNPNKRAALGSVILGGAAGLFGGQAAGSVLEEKRRRDNFEKRNPTVDYDVYRKNAQKILDRKYELMQANPNAKAERGQSKTGFNKRNQQQALLEVAQKQQAMIDQLEPGPAKQQAEQAMGKQMWALDKASAIDQEIQRRSKKKEDEEPTSIF